MVGAFSSLVVVSVLHHRSGANVKSGFQMCKGVGNYSPGPLFTMLREPDSLVVLLMAFFSSAV